MSLYIGDDDIGRSIVHITNTMEEVNTMKNTNLLDSTVFHSSLPYLNIIASFTTNTFRSVVKLPYSVDHGPAYRAKFTMEVPLEAMPYFNDNYMVFIIVSSRNSGYERFNAFKVSAGVASTISVQPHYTSTGYASFTDKINFNNNGNGYEENISAYPNSTYKYIELAWGRGTFYSSALLQGSGRLENIDEISSTGLLYVINIKDNNYYPIINNPNSVLIGNNKFHILGDTTFDLANARFLERNRPYDQYSFKLDNLMVNPLNLNPLPIVEIDLKSIYGGNSFITKKLSDNSIVDIVNSSSTKFIRYAGTITVPIDSTMNYSGTTIIDLSSLSNVAFFIIVLSGDYLNGWKNLDIKPSFIEMSEGDQEKTIGSHTIITTNSQGGYTECYIKTEISYTSNIVRLSFITSFMHSYFTTKMRLLGTCNILYFK